ncbi:betaine-aldehyde dehydrogenase [Paenibacillus forsythiae]|uniref:Betaine-aldehyde dehydrogenase n=1 Tax=Paenibacillus forsythiae TaxID=365616 RepID=A0ABU3H2A1_9BACL|nr:aldehyde dehydrogenase family protein [Paenibacillus forsythiae]MDT3424949.1 betaine-aldehyde dehydrogenase [Paenibacillus forsythiae]
MPELNMYIDGQWLGARSGSKRQILNPANGEIIAIAAEGGREDARLAILSARRAFDSAVWSEVSPAERAKLLYLVADLLEEHAEEIALLETKNMGKPLRESRFDVADAAACFRYYAGLITKPMGQVYNVADPVQGLVVREPVGVCGLIVPWNYPLLMSVWKIAPALAAGNSIVLKPSELTPVTAVRLFRIFEDAGIPQGVANLVLGTGPEVGQELAESELVDLIAFTGGTATGRTIMKAAAGNMKNISLELGGKSPNIVFADADFETAVDYALFAIFANQGQVCAAGSRLLLEESIHDRFVERLVERARQIRIGSGDEEGTEMGPLVSAGHMEKVLHYIELGKREGARLVLGGQRLKLKGLENGYFVEPTIFTDTTPEMSIVRDEIFGPVLAIQTFKDEPDAIRVANDSVYGLAAGVFTNDNAKALRVVKKLRAGITWINTFHNTYNEAPWGGYKQSGIGRALGTFGLDAYTEIKQININLQVQPIGWFEN